MKQTASGSIDFDDEHCCITGGNDGEWGQIVGIKGSGFFNVTGVLFGTNRQPSLDFFVPERNYISAEIPDEITVIRVDFDLIIGIIIAIKVSGMINCKSKNSGKSLPNHTPNNVEICQDKNNVMPEPKR